MARPRSRILRAGSTLLTVALVVVSVAALAGRVAGLRALVEHSGSMSPVITAGDLVVTRQVRAAVLRTGDIATFPDRTRDGELVTHRVTEVRFDGDLVTVHTRGDANNAGEQWTTPRDSIVGRTVAVVPSLGWATAFLGRPAVAAGLNGLLAALLVGLLLGRSRPGRRRGAGPARHAAGAR